MTDFALIAARAVHIGASMLLFGELLFAFGITTHLPRSAVAPLSHESGSDESRLRTVVPWALAVSAVSSAIWLVLEAASMTGSPLQALDLGTMTLVLRESVFGH